jgi:hypothetical protein
VIIATGACRCVVTSAVVAAAHSATIRRV